MACGVLQEQMYKIYGGDETALDVGITFFDQNDIYGCDGGGSFGDSEKLFGTCFVQILLSDQMIIATKGGIVLGIPYDSSASYLKSR